MREKIQKAVMSEVQKAVTGHVAALYGQSAPHAGSHAALAVAL
jgi:hypothetical protein